MSTARTAGSRFTPDAVPLTPRFTERVRVVPATVVVEGIDATYHRSDRLRDAAAALLRAADALDRVRAGVTTC